MKKLQITNIILVSSLLIAGFLNSYTFNMYYFYGHLNLFPAFFIILEYIKLTSFLLLPLGIYYQHKSSRNMAKTILPIVSILSFIYYSTYTSLDKSIFPFSNSNNLDSVTLEIYNNINLFMPKLTIQILFCLENILIFISSTIILIQDKFKLSDLTSFKYFPVVLILLLPLNIFQSLVDIFPENVYRFFEFDNFTIWHFLSFISLIAVTLLAYSYLKKKDYSKQILYLRGLAIVMMVHYFSKNSMVIGDGYNVYNLVFSTIPLFICDIGKFIVVLAVFTNKKVFYDIAYFVHSAGALTVFFYFGKEGTHNYGTIFSYSFLYFSFTHLLLFMISVLPIMLKITSFKFKDIKIPIIYYGIVILISTFTSVLITNYMSEVTNHNGQHLPFIYQPNYAFTQICPVPVNFPTFMNFKIGICEVNMFYEIVLYLAYVCIFFAFYIFQFYAPIILNKIKQSKLFKKDADN